MRGRIFAITSLIIGVSLFTGCAGSSKYNKITKDTFWESLENKEFDAKYDASRDIEDILKGISADKLDEWSMYDDGDVRFVFLDCDSAKSAKREFKNLKDEYEDDCNAKSSTSTDTVQTWKGTSKSDDFFINVCRIEDQVIWGEGTYADKKLVVDTIKYLLTEEFDTEEPDKDEEDDDTASNKKRKEKLKDKEEKDNDEDIEEVADIEEENKDEDKSMEISELDEEDKR